MHSKCKAKRRERLALFSATQYDFAYYMAYMHACSCSGHFSTQLFSHVRSMNPWQVQVVFTSAMPHILDQQQPRPWQAAEVQHGRNCGHTSCCSPWAQAVEKLVPLLSAILGANPRKLTGTLEQRCMHKYEFNAHCVSWLAGTSFTGTLLA